MRPVRVKSNRPFLRWIDFFRISQKKPCTVPEILAGSQDAQDARFGVVVSRFNEPVTERLLAGALEALAARGADMDQVTVARCPGAVEIPLVARKLAGTGSYDAIICLGAVIRGETPHFEAVCHAASCGAARTALDLGLPVSFGVLTTDTAAQALARSGGEKGNKGADAAAAAIEMVNLLRDVERL